LLSHDDETGINIVRHEPNLSCGGRAREMPAILRELRQANEILRKASAYFAMAELDRRSKP
jgi:transposase